MPTGNERKVKHRGFTPMQMLFIKEYPVDMNGTESALRAGCKTRRGACVQAGKWLSNPAILEAVNKEVERVLTAKDMKLEDVKAEIIKLARFDVRKLYDENGRLKPLHELDDDTAACIASVEEYEEIVKGEKLGTTKKTRAWDKVKALEMLAKHFKLFSDAPVNNVQVNIVQLLPEEIKTFKELFDKEY